MDHKRFVLHFTPTSSSWLNLIERFWGFLPIIIYSFMGFELMNSAGAAIKKPKRDVPKMILMSGAVLLGAYMLATFGILASLKLHDLSIVTGIADAMKLSFDSILKGFG